ncbi:hypothetical protein [Myxococcus stipitatus]|uniref:hypothetical protein n=1 Tax=Myxococcus stipitatus TaxID=83455 RepID=UPI0003107B25|nr:hypothetical protein [Myxococcus stipitatus]
MVDARGNLIGGVRVSEKGGRWSGDIDLGGTASSIVSLFTRFEEMVNGQMFSFLDEMEAEIRQLGVRLLTTEGTSLPVDDLQIYPAERVVSFRTP